MPSDTMPDTLADPATQPWTPAPWHIDPEWRGGTQPIAIYAKQGPIDVCPAMAHGLAEARLIAAAPDLFDALQAVLDTRGRPHPEEYVDGGRSYTVAMVAFQRAQQALAKARGNV